MFQVCGVPEEKFRQISSAVDKLDKMPWQDVRKEMVEEKGLDGEVADRIEQYVNLKGNDIAFIHSLEDLIEFSRNPSVREGLDEMKLLFEYLEAFKVLPEVCF